MSWSRSSALLRETLLFTHAVCKWAAMEKQGRPGALNNRHVLSYSLGGNGVQGDSAVVSVAGEDVFVL